VLLGETDGVFVLVEVTLVVPMSLDVIVGEPVFVVVAVGDFERVEEGETGLLEGERLRDVVHVAVGEEASRRGGCCCWVCTLTLSRLLRSAGQGGRAGARWQRWPSCP
jgi:hypothetical protein